MNCVIVKISDFLIGMKVSFKLKGKKFIKQLEDRQFCILRSVGW